MTCTIGFLINPIAGMGGAVGLKGTDGLLQEAVRRGARPVSGVRALAMLRDLGPLPCRVLTCSGPMGAEVLHAAGIDAFETVYVAPAVTSPDDTRKACMIFEERGADLVLFCGGDGTAGDVYAAVLDRVPILGIPAGVKMFSAVFAVTPQAAADIVRSLLSSSLHLRDAEVVDVDEEAYRNGELRTRLIGYAKSPYLPGLVQGTKQVWEEQDEERAKQEIGRFLADVILGTPQILYLLGPGTTTGAIAGALGIVKTLLGFDAVKGGVLVATDLNEEAILTLMEGEKRCRLVIGIIGAQGAVLGRGTQQVGPEVLRKIGVEQVIVVATPHKLSETPLLFLDTGDPALDRAFGEYIAVISGYGVAQRKHIGRSEEGG